MKKILFILSFLLIWISAESQSLVTVGLTKAQVADSINANLIELMDYKDETLTTVFDTLSDTHTSADLAGLMLPLDSLALLYGVTLTDSLYYGQKGVMFRLAINTMFEELYEVYDYVVIPLVGTMTADESTVCRTTPTTVTFTGSGGMPPYHFIYERTTGTSVIDTVVTVSGSSISVDFPNITAGDFEYVLYSMYDEGTVVKQDAQADTISYSIRPLPSATISGTTTVTQGDASPNITFTGASATWPYTFTYNINSGTSQTYTTISGSSRSLPAPTDVIGVFVYTLENVSDTYGCEQDQTGSATITVEPIVSPTLIDRLFNRITTRDDKIIKIR